MYAARGLECRVLHLSRRSCERGVNDSPYMGRSETLSRHRVPSASRWFAVQQRVAAAESGGNAPPKTSRQADAKPSQVPRLAHQDGAGPGGRGEAERGGVVPNLYASPTTPQRHRNKITRSSGQSFVEAANIRQIIARLDEAMAMQAMGNNGRCFDRWRLGIGA